ncbi:MAG: SEL1-like repeat protein [Victivallales bacterium]|nr:SEL1-like repeat protein [Victivallales bacterium]
MIADLCPLSWGETINEIIKSAVGGIAFVYIGAMTAPRFRFAVSLALALFYGIACIMLIILAAEQGHIIAQIALGSRCNNGHGVPKDEAKAVHWYRKAANVPKRP